MLDAYRLAAILLGVLTAAGCATTGTERSNSPSTVTKYVSAPLTYAIIKRLHKPIYAATIQNNEGKYQVLWSSTLSGNSDYAGPDFGHARIIDEGTFANWKWSIRGSPRIESSSNLWSHPTSGRSASDAPVHDWRSGMQLLHKLSAYLLGEAPRAIDAHIMLVPTGQAFSLRAQHAIEATTQLDFAAAYPISLSTSNSFQSERFGAAREALARLGGSLQHLELAMGVSAAPAHEPAHSIKDAANSFCWNISVRPALAAYTDAEIPDGDVGSSAIELGAAMYAQHPDSQLALGAYAVFLDITGINDYLRSRGLKWPESGRDIDEINGLLEYCRALIQSNADISKKALSTDRIDPIPFFTHKVDVGRASPVIVDPD